MTLTKAHRQAAERQIRAELQRRRDTLDPLLSFVKRSHGAYQAGWVHEDICARLERFSRDVAAKRSPRLILCLPPRHGKSELVGRRWPIYHLGHNPTHEIVYATYGQELANKVSRKARALSLETSKQLPHLGKGETWNVEHWEIAGGGSYQATGVGGPLTGSGAHCLILDDLLKNAEDAYSAVKRDSTWDWYETTAYTRLSPGGGVLAMGTRWHEDDPIGRMLEAGKSGGDTWDVIVYPAIAEMDEDHRREGEALHPDRYPIEELRAKQRVLSARTWAALYQQRPAPAEGGIFQRLWFVREKTTCRNPPSTFHQEAISVDCSFKKTSDSSFVVMQYWGRFGAHYYLLDQVRARMDYPETKSALAAFCAKHPTATMKLIENRANGSALIADLQASIPGLVPFDPSASKEARASIAAALFEAGNVFLPHYHDAPWIQEYAEEFCAFPAGVNDDQVDATSQILIKWSQDMPSVSIGGWNG